MPATRKPTNVLEMSGAFAHDPQRKRDREHEPTPTGPLGNAPESMTAAQKKMWDEFASEIPPGVAGNCDRTLFEMAVKLRNLVRTGRANAAEFGLLIACIREMGMTPVTRSKVKATVEKEREEWEQDFGN
jgi:hypothetical protein